MANVSVTSLRARFLPRIGVVLTLVSLNLGGVAAPPPASAGTPGTELWASRYNGPGRMDDVANAAKISPDGSTVFVTGGSPGSKTGHDYATLAYDAATGSKVWTMRYDGPAHSLTRPRPSR